MGKLKSTEWKNGENERNFERKREKAKFEIKKKKEKNSVRAGIVQMRLYKKERKKKKK